MRGIQRTCRESYVLLYTSNLHLLLLGQKVTGLNMKTAIFLMCLIGLGLALAAQVEQKRVARSDSDSNSDSDEVRLPSATKLAQILELLKQLGFGQVIWIGGCSSPYLNQSRTPRIPQSAIIILHKCKQCIPML
ncbi:hypothetical protein AAFF_G00273370 [Aldrovandia affinis]|uniref:Uncharacterized protein n=1 Tax=Aldrovandia affinis TaxID=143900 RepID=A0AAD7SRK1_9TELE|nr:hypothetical protein AAFF_G00273370 [Aldrovandia affinis]